MSPNLLNFMLLFPKSQANIIEIVCRLFGFHVSKGMSMFRWALLNICDRVAEGLSFTAVPNPANAPSIPTAAAVDIASGTTQTPNPKTPPPQSPNPPTSLPTSSASQPQNLSSPPPRSFISPSQTSTPDTTPSTSSSPQASSTSPITRSSLPAYATNLPPSRPQP